MLQKGQGIKEVEVLRAHSHCTRTLFHLTENTSGNVQWHVWPQAVKDQFFLYKRSVCRHFSHVKGISEDHYEVGQRILLP